MSLGIDEVFDVSRKIIIGVVHLPPLPGAPLFRGEFDRVLDIAIREAKTLERGGVDGIILENFGDIPFRAVVRNPLTISAFSVIAREVAREVSIPIGINFLRNSAVEAASIAYISGAKFIRVNAYVETVATDSGIIRPAAPRLIRFLRAYGIRLCILADIYVKHGKVIGIRNIADTVRDAVERGLASAIIITGKRTGAPPNPKALKEAKSTGTHVFIGSGLSTENIDLLRYADGAIIGTFFKKEGRIYNPIDENRVRRLVELARKIHSVHS